MFTLGPHPPLTCQIDLELKKPSVLGTHKLWELEDSSVHSLHVSPLLKCYLGLIRDSREESSLSLAGKG